MKGKCSFVSIVLLWEIPKNFSCCLFYFLQRKQKCQSPRKRAAFHTLLGNTEKEKLRSPREVGSLLFFFSSFWCYQLHCVKVISGIQRAGLHHTNLDPQLRHSLIRTNMILILSLIPSPSPQGHEGLELFFL